MSARRPRLQPLAFDWLRRDEPRPLRRFRPAPGQLLTVENIRGAWWPTGAVDACGFFAVRWAARHCDYWAALHDFHPADQLRLVENCRWQDEARGRSL